MGEKRGGDKVDMRRRHCPRYFDIEFSLCSILLQFISGVSLNKSHDCGECRDINVILQHQKC